MPDASLQRTRAAYETDWQRAIREADERDMAFWRRLQEYYEPNIEKGLVTQLDTSYTTEHIDGR